MSDHYPQVVRAVSETPWAIVPAKLHAILDMLAVRASGERLTEEEIQARVGGRVARKDASQAGSVAVLPIYGVITPKADMFTEMSGGTSVQRFRDDFRAAVNDPSVSGIVLDIDSPGGQVEQIPEMAAEIRAAKGKKPIVAVANAMAASAAYWLGSQADELVVTPSGEVGSIGVFAAHNDLSAAQEKVGVKTTLVSAGKYKTENSPFAPLSEEAQAAIQSRVDDAYGMFTRDVAKGRGATVEDVRSGYGEGRILTASQALKAGMVDRIATLDDTIARVTALAAPKNGSGSTASSQVVTFATDGTSNIAAYLQADGQVVPITPVAAESPPGTLTFTTNTAAASGLFYAPIGASWDEEQTAIAAAALDYIDRMSSLGEARRGALSASKRAAMTSFEAVLREAADSAHALLAANDPDKDMAALIAERVRYERHRAA